MLAVVEARTECSVEIVPPLAPETAPGPDVDLVEMAGADAGPLIAAGRLAVINERGVNGLADVPGRLRDAVRDPSGALRAVPYLWSPQMLLARRSAFGEQPPTSLRSLFARRSAARAALPDSPLELAVAARYLGIGNPFALARDELAAARETLAPARPLVHLYGSASELRSLFRRNLIDLALGNPSTLGDQRADVEAVLPERGNDRRRARARHRLGHASLALRAPRRRRAPGARLAGAAGADPRAPTGAQRDLHGARARCLQDAPARALEHARGERHGRSAGGRGGRHGLAGMGG